MKKRDRTRWQKVSNPTALRVRTLTITAVMSVNGLGVGLRSLLTRLYPKDGLQTAFNTKTI